jgi:hypothetical protein
MPYPASVSSPLSVVAIRAIRSRCGTCQDGPVAASDTKSEQGSYPSVGFADFGIIAGKKI